jgi:dipeptidase E
MKLYLSSYRLGNVPEKLKEMVGENKKAAIIHNSLDHSTDFERLKKSKADEANDLLGLGFEPEELDLRDYFGKTDRLREKILDFGLVWVRGGNSFVLRRAMRASGFDEIIKAYTGNETLVYAGYSAGICVLSPSLKGLELVDDPNILPMGYPSELIWEGIGLIRYCIAPHYHSVHPESEAINKVVEYYIENKILFIALHDGEVLLETI